jgi:hypothetical protein
MALGFSQPVTVMTTKNLSRVKAQPARKAENKM